MRVAFHTLGCKVNHYETEAMREAFVSRGAVSVGEEEPADAYIINTCTVTNIADRKSRQYIRRVKRVNPDALIVVTGCYAQVEPEEVAAMPEVDLVIGNGQKARICDLVYSHLAQHNDNHESSRRDKLMMVKPRSELTEYEDMGLVSSSEPGMTRAYIKIQEGCDRFCAYCLIPYARGSVRSRPPEEILREAAMLLDSGVREIVLTGINTALYGTEPGFTYELADEDGKVFPGLESIAAMSEAERGNIAPIEVLLDRLDSIRLTAPEPGAPSPDFRVRLSSLEPTVVDKDHVEKIIRHRRLCHHLHLSVQNGSNRILRSMNRHYTREEYLDIVRAIREYDPLYGITTDIIVGFPGETEEDFRDTLDIVAEAGFGRVHVFKYSPRKGTAGASLPDAVPGEVKNERSDELERAAEHAARDFMKANFNTEHKVLIEEVQDGYMTGYTDNYIKVYIPADSHRADDGANAAAYDSAAAAGRAGKFCMVRLKELFRDGCIAEIDRVTDVDYIDTV